MLTLSLCIQKLLAWGQAPTPPPPHTPGLLWFVLTRCNQIVISHHFYLVDYWQRLLLNWRHSLADWRWESTTWDALEPLCRAQSPQSWWRQGRHEQEPAWPGSEKKQAMISLQRIGDERLIRDNFFSRSYLIILFLVCFLIINLTAQLSRFKWRTF